MRGAAGAGEGSAARVGRRGAVGGRGRPGSVLIRQLIGPLPQWAPVKRLLILGSTGSIGKQALDVVSRAQGAFEVVGLSAARDQKTLIAQAREHGVPRVALTDPDAAARAAEAWTGGEVLHGPEGLIRLVAESDADLVLNSIVGSAGLGPTIVALTEGIDVALANKESLVVGGELVTALAEATGARLIPIDSEHTALHHLLTGEPPGRGRAARDHRLGRPVPGSQGGGAPRRDGRAGAEPPDVEHGRQDHDRLARR